MTKSRADSPIEGVAVVGMSGRFPGAKNISEFWKNLEEGVESIEFPSDEELRAAGVELDWLKKPNYVKARSILEDIDLFDAPFFGINPQEASILDPQHRLFLECSWEALENAGYDPETYQGLVGVYASGSSSSYFLHHLFLNRELKALVGSFQLMLSNDREYLPMRVSYKLNLRGPSINVQTACSSSLVAVHLACQGLLNYQCDMALAGGVSVRVQRGGYTYQQGGILSPDGHCRTFDSKAQGTIFGSGLGVVILKRLEDAYEDGDNIHAVIRGSAINNDGSGKVGYTAPSVEGQTKVIAEAQALAGVRPESITYVEAHGTATSLGDPIEISALKNVFEAKTQKKGYCGVGSVKTNIGHLDAAAGVAGLIKTVLALKHRTIPPSLNFKEPNPEIDFQNSPFFVNSSLSEWQSNGSPLRAGVSSFGVGGTNAHVVLEAATARADSSQSLPWQLLQISAKTQNALDRSTKNVVEHLRSHPEVNLADVAYTLRVGRGSFDHRRMLVCESVAGAVEALEKLDPKRVSSAVRKGGHKSVVFMFSGQGSQYVNMGLGLYRHESTFRKYVDLCAEILKTPLKQDLRKILYPEEDGLEEANNLINQTFVTQPTLFVIEYALAKLWLERGVRPEAMIGHSVGEYVAACMAGAMGLKDALELVAERGRLMQRMPKGAMLSVPLSEAELTPLLREGVSLAAVNGPSLCVVSGPVDAIDEFEGELAERNTASRRLHTSHAFHSEMMEPIIDEFVERVKKIAMKAPQIPYLSNVSGTWVTEEEVKDPAYWGIHLRKAVRFADGLKELGGTGDRVLLEVGPGRMLNSLARQHPSRTAGGVVLSSLRHPKDRRDDLEFVLGTWGQLWLAGVDGDVKGFYRRERRRRVELPTYPFDRERYWIEQQKQEQVVNQRPLEKKNEIADWFYVPSWRRSVALSLLRPGNLPGPEVSWLVFQDSVGVGSEIVGWLRTNGQKVTCVKAGTEYKDLGNGEFVIDPAERGHFAALLDQAAGDETIPLMVVHLWNLTSTPEETSGLEDLDEMQTMGFGSLLYLAQALGEKNYKGSVHIGVVSNQMYAVDDEEFLRPEKSTSLGPCKIIPAEYPNVTCQSIDIEVPGSQVECEDLIAPLMSEFLPTTSDKAIAYRKGRRWVQTFDAVRLHQSNGAETAVKQNGVYLITGGLGGIGLVLAKQLVNTNKVSLVLVGRSALPDREDWENWLESHPGPDETSQKIRRIKELEENGADVLVLQADVTDKLEMESVVRSTHERFGAINGVVHAAGVPGGGLIQLKTWEMATTVMAPKVRGTLVLDAVLKEEKLDFMVLCSSLTAILGGVGQVDYCGANAFLDAFALYRSRRDGTCTVAVDWDAWAEVGMAVKAAQEYGRPARDPEIGPQGVAAESVHPLFDKIYRNGEQVTFLGDMSTAKHWVLNEHRISGKPTLVGTAYLEMALAAFRDEAADQSVRMENVTFIAPLTVDEGEERTVETIVRKAATGFDFVIRSRLGRNGKNGAKWQEHAMGRIMGAGVERREPRDLHDIIERCSNEVIITEPRKEGEPVNRKTGTPMDFGPRWKNLKEVHVGNDEAVAVLELPQEFVGDVDTFHLHPALMDIAVGFASAKFRGDGLYLPFAYGGVQVHGSLGRRLYSHAKLKEGGNGGSEVLKFDVVITNDTGEEAVEVTDFTMRRISDKMLQAMSGRRATEGERSSATEGSGAGRSESRSSGLLGDAIFPEEGCEAFRRIVETPYLRQVVVSTKDLMSRLERASNVTSASVLKGMEKKMDVAQPAHPRPNMQTEYVAPRNELEEGIAGIWQKVLGIEEIGIHDDLLDLGGHSLLAVQIISQIRDAFAVNLPTDMMFNTRTVATLAEAIMQELAERADSDLLSQVLDEVDQLQEEEARSVSVAGAV